jgi:hypothetical protein
MGQGILKGKKGLEARSQKGSKGTQKGSKGNVNVVHNAVVDMLALVQTERDERVGGVMKKGSRIHSQICR